MTPRVFPVDLGPDVGAWFTGRSEVSASDVPFDHPGNLSHRRPHVPARLAATRRALGEAIGLEPSALHPMQQVHGRAVGVVSSATPRGAEARGVDALVTREAGRALVVQVADCVPVLLASSRGVVTAVHAGRRGVELGVVAAAMEALDDGDRGGGEVRAAVGPAIGGCCYEVPADMQAAVVAEHPAAKATTTWGTPALDLPSAVAAQLRALGATLVEGVDACTRCDPQGRFFSHRADPRTGRQVGIVVRDGA